MSIVHPALDSGIAAVLFAATFVLGGRLHPFRSLIRERRTLLSFCAGMSMAYVFVHVMPELSEARHNFVHATDLETRFEGKAIYFLALLGFLFYYGLDHMRRRLSTAEAAEGAAFRLHVGGFAAYVWLVSLLLVGEFSGSARELLPYTLAMCVHFLSVDASLRHEHGAAYESRGRVLLAGMALLGWLTGVAVDFPADVKALMLAFVSGAIIMNSAIMELPSEKDGRFIPFLAGGVLYGLLLLPLG